MTQQQIDDARAVALMRELEAAVGRNYWSIGRGTDGAIFAHIDGKMKTAPTLLEAAERLHQRLMPKPDPLEQARKVLDEAEEPNAGTAGAWRNYLGNYHGIKITESQAAELLDTHPRFVRLDDGRYYSLPKGTRRAMEGHP